MAKVICAWCGKVMKKNIKTSTGQDSHSICEDCEKKLRAENDTNKKLGIIIIKSILSAAKTLNDTSCNLERLSDSLKSAMSTFINLNIIIKRIKETK